jgi:hypothetical protein
MALVVLKREAELCGDNEQGNEQNFRMINGKYPILLHWEAE